MPFGLCNAPATFQRCMLSIFSDMVERIMEVFMDDITVYGSSYKECLLHLEVFSTDAPKALALRALRSIAGAFLSHLLFAETRVDSKLSSRDTKAGGIFV
ncbi:hypothetical protein CK203_056787 [Vitis vinifera]|uniref:Reverse transcriptase domain-containing protein n=1 Tax=Vitis vinifera TaxID=29760 RepID=A0A438FVH5_VITVI|nr:hypothetical protein CK203_056787 [Vitis vinifera]